MTRPGVYVSEAPLPKVITSPTSTQSYGAFMGTALQGPTDPVLVRSWSDFNSIFGGFSTNVTLPLALFQFFNNGGSAAYVARVTVTGSTAATAIYSDAVPTERIAFTAASVGQWGNGLSFRIINASTVVGVETFDLELSQVRRGTRVVVERFTRLSMKPDDPRYLVSIVNSPTIGSSYVSVVDLVGDGHFGITDVTYTALSGGGDGTGTPAETDYAATFKKFDPIDAMLLVNIPGDSNVNSIVTLVEARGDSVLIVDTPENTPPADIIAGTAPLPSGTSYASIYYPWVYISDPAPEAPRGGVTKVPPGASVAGMIIRTDSTRGIFKAPAGAGAGLGNVVAHEQRLTNDELDTIAALNINVVRPISGIGIAAMGARTRSTDTAQYLSVRRTLNWVKKKAVIASRFALFEPNTAALWDQLRVANGVYLHELWQQGGLQGLNPTQAYYVKCDEDINTPQTIANGEVHIEIGVAPVFPAEFIIIRVGQFEADASVIATEEV